MATGLYSWSQTAATNATADSTINWAEGQAPSTVNDSARALMAVVSKWRDDISGVTTANAILTTAGTATAQTLVTNISIAALTNGWTVSFKVGANLTNTGACTLAVDSLTAKNIQRVSGTNLIGGELIAGSVYTVTYHQPADTWVLHHAVRHAGVELLVSGTVSSAATLSIAAPVWASFRAVKFYLTGFQPVSDDVDFWCRTSTDGGSNYDAAASDYEWAYTYSDADFQGAGSNDDADSEITINHGVGNASTECINVEYTLWNPNSAAFHTQMSWIGTKMNADSDIRAFTGAGRRSTAANVDAIRFMFSSGNVDEGSYSVYGIA